VEDAEVSAREKGIEPQRLSVNDERRARHRIRLDAIESGRDEVRFSTEGTQRFDDAAEAGISRLEAGEHARAARPPRNLDAGFRLDLGPEVLHAFARAERVELGNVQRRCACASKTSRAFLGAAPPRGSFRRLSSRSREARVDALEVARSVECQERRAARVRRSGSENPVPMVMRAMPTRAPRERRGRVVAHDQARLREARGATARREAPPARPRIREADVQQDVRGA
jgi:hypothetical protein